MRKIELLFLNSEDLYLYKILKEFLVQNVSRIKFLFLESEENIFKGKRIHIQRISKKKFNFRHILD